jgi:NAD(P)-dependent dehydrogenase (short-subunit alcohol dehydrogenase family)
MQGLIENKVAVITGAGSGLGRAAALLFAQHGAQLVLGDINAADAETTAAQVREAGGKAVALRSDVSREPEVEALVQAAVEAYGRLDIIFNNVGITLAPRPGQRRSLLLDASAEDIARLQAVNVASVMFGCKAAIRQFTAQGGGGAIVNTASVAGLIGWGGVVYGATKGAVVNLTRALALEVAAQGIRVNSVCPAGMPTRYAGMDPDGPSGERARASMAAMHPLGRPIEPADCANAALFLVSDMASNITGVNLPVDGGMAAGVPAR